MRLASGSFVYSITRLFHVKNNVYISYLHVESYNVTFFPDWMQRSTSTQKCATEWFLVEKWTWICRQHHFLQLLSSPLIHIFEKGAIHFELFVMMLRAWKHLSLHTIFNLSLVANRENPSTRKRIDLLAVLLPWDFRMCDTQYTRQINDEHKINRALIKWTRTREVHKFGVSTSYDLGVGMLLMTIISYLRCWIFRP